MGIIERDRPPDRLRRAGARLATTVGYLLVAALGVAVPVLLGVVAGTVLGGTAPSLILGMALAATGAVYWSRLLLCGLWWTRTAEWDWRSTSLRRGVRAWGWPL